MIVIQRWIVDLFNTLAAWYYRRKFGAAARQFGRLPGEEMDDRRGFVLVEIDGLAYDYLRQALSGGYMPQFSRLLLERKLRLARWNCGLPSTTPASQAGIMYGNNWDIPGFRWYDKTSGETITCKVPGMVRVIQERISTGRAGLLRGGSSYTNLFDGDARLALFTVSALGRHRVFENVRGLGFLVLFALSPVRVLRVFGLSLWTWLAYVAKRTASWVVNSFASRSILIRPHFTFFGPLLEIFNDVIFREVATFSVMMDIYRGMPAIYVAYTGYDEIAHHFGADSKEAFRSLRGIDKQIRQLERMRHLYLEHDYDLYILSDHGMTPSVPFPHAYGQTLRDFIAEHTGQEVRTGEAHDETEGLSEARVRFLLDEIRGLEARSHRPLSSQLWRVTRQHLEERLMAEALAAGWDLSRRGDIVARSSGSLAHVYFNVAPRPMDLSEVVLLHSSLLESLVDHDGIGLVVGREGQEVVITGRAGTLRIGPEAHRLEGENPLAHLSHPERVAQQIARVARFPHAGDLILFGAWDGTRVISFEEQVASHGGLGGPQTWPFIAFPTRERFLARGIENSEEVYTRLVGIHGGYS